MGDFDSDPDPDSDSDVKIRLIIKAVTSIRKVTYVHCCSPGRCPEKSRCVGL